LWRQVTLSNGKISRIKYFPPKVSKDASRWITIVQPNVSGFYDERLLSAKLAFAKPVSRKYHSEPIRYGLRLKGMPTRQKTKME
jgi:hypothetical protein